MIAQHTLIVKGEPVEAAREARKRGLVVTQQGKSRYGQTQLIVSGSSEVVLAWWKERSGLAPFATGTLLYMRERG